MVKPISNSEIYKTIRPVGYPNALKLPVYAYDYLMGNESEPLKTKSGKPHLAEEFWATAMSMPGERQYLKESKYKPSVAKDPDAKYYTIRDIIDQDALIGAAKDLKAGEKMEMNGLLPILDSKPCEVIAFSAASFAPPFAALVAAKTAFPAFIGPAPNTADTAPSLAASPTLYSSSRILFSAERPKKPPSPAPTAPPSKVPIGPAAEPRAAPFIPPPIAPPSEMREVKKPPTPLCCGFLAVVAGF